MKAGLVTSVTLHAALLGFGLVSLSAPRAYEVSDVESLPVDIIPIESITQVQEGDKKAELSEKPAPKPTKRPDPVPDAQKVGDNDVDLKTPPTPEARPREVEQAAEPPPSPKPQPKPEPKPAPETQEAKAEKTPVPATEVRPEPQPKQDVKPDPVAETIVAESPEAESVTLPDNAPVPQARPQPPKASTAKAPERKDSEKPAQKTASQPKSQDSDKLFDEVAALLNKDKASGGGAKRSEQQASLGGERKSAGDKLSQSEMDALRGQIQRCWNVPAGALDAENLKVSIQVRLDASGAIEGAPRIIAGGSGSVVERAAAESARRAVLQCAPYNLPAEKYEAWADVIVHFDPSDMF
ncbi:hypothetical protein [Nitratireductor pacificus]|uniref:TolA, TolA protein n=1 Tax=Nitratireductor pacificus pht-3B TaxID=391937 RepID=K2M9S3_9HYPH|nr:hypothetical protein [Nitratireductor pacificus]EKF18891.1 TolA, TolA protein [Nitratireductor pacificus pht-3B]